MEVHGDSSVFEGGQFVAPATVYVQLVYDPNSNDSVSFSDSYPARVVFDIENGAVTIKNVIVDTRSFYE